MLQFSFKAIFLSRLTKPSAIIDNLHLPICLSDAHSPLYDLCHTDALPDASLLFHIHLANNNNNG